MFNNTLLVKEKYNELKFCINNMEYCIPYNANHRHLQFVLSDLKKNILSDDLSFDYWTSAYSEVNRIFEFMAIRDIEKVSDITKSQWKIIYPTLDKFEK